jgi:hypothetical protein
MVDKFDAVQDSLIASLPAGGEPSSAIPVIEHQCFNDALMSSSAACIVLRIWFSSGSVLAAESKKADDASMDTLRIP